MIGTLARAAQPTARAIRWSPVGGVAAVLAGASLIANSSPGPADALLLVAAAALASAWVGALHDPAARLLAPLPVSEMSRRALRLAVVAVPVLPVWAALTLVTTSSPGASAVGPLLALVATGMCCAVWAHPRVGTGVGAFAPVLWYALDRTVPGSGLVGDLAGLWRTDPWSVAAVAVVLVVLGRRR